MNKFNKKLSAMGLKGFDFYESLFMDFMVEESTTPHTLVYTPPMEYNNAEFFTMYPEGTCSYKRNGDYLDGGSMELGVGDIIHVGYLEFGRDYVQKIEITPTGWLVHEETSVSQNPSIFLYKGIRNKFFEAAELPNIGLSHQLFDTFIANCYK